VSLPEWVTLLPPKSEPSECDAGEVNRVSTFRAARTMLSSIYKNRFKDFDSWIAATDALQSAGAAAKALAGTNSGADRGQLDLLKLVGTGALETLRQGFSKVFVAELHCTREPERRYSLTAKVLDFKKLLRGRGGHSAGGPIDSVNETFRSPTQARAALASALSRLLDSYSIRFLDARDTLPAQKEHVVSFRASRPSSAPTDEVNVAVSLGRLSTSKKRELCDGVRNSGSFGDEGPVGTFEVRFEEVGDFSWEWAPDSESEATATIGLKPLPPGFYLLRATLSVGKERKVTDLRCFSAAYAHSPWWLTAMGIAYSADIGVSNTEHTGGLLLAGYRVDFQEGTFGWGPVLGVGRESFALASPRSWDDAGRQGWASPVRYASTSVLGGLGVTKATILSTTTLDLTLLLLADQRFLDVKLVPGTLTNFLEHNEGSRTIGDLDTTVVVLFGVTPAPEPGEPTLGLSGGLAIRGLEDFGGANIGSISYNPSVDVLFGLRLRF
jgi:hypothetical protein